MTFYGGRWRRSVWRTCAHPRQQIYKYFNLALFLERWVDTYVGWSRYTLRGETDLAAEATQRGEKIFEHVASRVRFTLKMKILQ